MTSVHADSRTPLHLRLRVANVHDPELGSGSQENPIWHLNPESHPGRLLVPVVINSGQSESQEHIFFPNEIRRVSSRTFQRFYIDTKFRDPPLCELRRCRIARAVKMCYFKDSKLPPPLLWKGLRVRNFARLVRAQAISDHGFESYEV